MNNRYVVICPSCWLTQFQTANYRCRKCHRLLSGHDEPSPSPQPEPKIPRTIAPGLAYTRMMRERVGDFVLEYDPMFQLN